MKLGIIGLPQSGKSTVFEVLTKTNNFVATHKTIRSGLVTVNVKDNRVDALDKIYEPRKKIYAQVEYFLPSKKKYDQKTRGKNDWNQVRDCDALVHVVRNFDIEGLERLSLNSICGLVTQELILSDTIIVEKRLERLYLEKKKGKKENLEELYILEKSLKVLEQEKPLSDFPEIVSNKLLRGYSFLSAKPILTLINNDYDDRKVPDKGSSCLRDNWVLIRAKLEKELAQMEEEEKQEFIHEFKISGQTTDQVIKKSYYLLGLISFFTVGKDEVRTWTIKTNTKAIDAAEIIHSDIKKGFIRAEVISYKDFMETRNYNEARKKGYVRVEGKVYIVHDGDIINFRFNI